MNKTFFDFNDDDFKESITDSLYFDTCFKPFLRFLKGQYENVNSFTSEIISKLPESICYEFTEYLKHNVKDDLSGNLLPYDYEDPYSHEMVIDEKDFISKYRNVIIHFLDYISLNFIIRFTITTEFDLKKTFFSDYFNKTVNKLDSMFSDWEKGITEQYIPTGFNNLDELLGGGLYSGLYTIGAVTSLGKTTFCLNLCDNIAKSGNDVMIFSTEMDDSEYIRRSLSRVSYEIAANKTECLSEKNLFSNNPFCTKDLMNKIGDVYRKYASRYEIIKGIGDTTTEKIDQHIKTHIEITHKKPVVVVDFFQLLEVTDYRYTDKQKADKNILELKKIADKYKIPMLVISSFNRTSYKDTVSLESFKESGNIEYISENVIALQFSDVKDITPGKNGEISRAAYKAMKDKLNERKKTGNSIKIDICVLKARKGVTGETSLYYVPMFNYMSDSKPKFDADPEPTKEPEKKDSAEGKANRPTTMKDILSGKKIYNN